MNKLFILCAVIHTFSIHAQEVDFDYRPFIEEGKVWVSKPEVNIIDESTKRVFTGIIVEYDYFQGDTIIGDRVCKRWVQDYRTIEGDRLTYRVIPMCEENRCVKFFLEGYTTPFIAYDFSAKIGDTITVVSPSAYLYERARKEGWLDDFFNRNSDTIVIKSKLVDELLGKKRTLTYFCTVLRGNTDWMLEQNFFMYGIGSHYCPNFNLYNNGSSGNGSFWLMYCVVGDEILYADEEKATYWGITCPTPETHPEMFGVTSSITTASTINCTSSSPSYFDLTGRRLSAPPTRGMYIENGRKRVANNE